MTAAVLLWTAIAAVAMAQPAGADEAYVFPPVGAQLTYRLLAKTTVADRAVSFTAGQIYSYTVTRVDGPVMQASVKPVAMIYGCPADSTNKDCAFAAKVAGAVRDGDLVTVPVPDAIGQAMSGKSHLESRYFFVEDRVFATPGPKDPDDPADGEFGEKPVFIVSSSLTCDPGQLKAFFPLGKAEHLTLACHSAFARTEARVGPREDRHADEAVTAELSYGGNGRITLPSGDWDVQKVALKLTSSAGDAAHSPLQTDLDIATELGVVVKSHSVLEIKTSHATSDITSELIAYKP